MKWNTKNPHDEWKKRSEDFRIQRLVEAAKREVFTVEALCERFGLSESTVRKLAKEHGFALEGKNE